MSYSWGSTPPYNSQNLSHLNKQRDKKERATWTLQTLIFKRRNRRGNSNWPLVFYGFCISGKVKMTAHSKHTSIYISSLFYGWLKCIFETFQQRNRKDIKGPNKSTQTWEFESQFIWTLSHSHLPATIQMRP